MVRGTLTIEFGKTRIPGYIGRGKIAARKVEIDGRAKLNPELEYVLRGAEELYETITKNARVHISR